MRTLNVKSVVLLGILLIWGCAHIPNLVAGVERGMDRESAIRRILKDGTPTFYYLKEGPTEYVLFRNVSSFGALYSEYPHTVEFIRLESGRVVDKGVVGKSEEQRIKKMRPNFVLQDWQGKGAVPADYYDSGRQ